jgi:nucleoside-diphosphate-sugar epimerase
MRALVIGCGYLGRRVAERWRDAGAQVFATTRRAEYAEELRRAGLLPLVCDVLQPDTLQGLPSVDVVAHAVALDRASAASMREVYVGGLRNVLEQLLRPARFVYVSSSSVYGQTDGSWTDETAEANPEEPAGQVVLEAERLLHSKLPGAIVLRFSGIYGPGRLLRRQAIEAGEPITADPEKWLNLIHVEDGARAVLAAAERGEPGRIYNVTDGAPVRRRDFYSEMARLLGAPPPRLAAPAAGAQLPPHERGNRRISNSRLREELGVELAYPDYRAGLAAAVGH